METFETITCELKGSVVEVTLNRPESRNAMSHQMVEELLSCFHDLAEESYSGVRVVVLRAAGKVFCAGGDVRDLREAHSGEVENRTAIARLDELLIAVNEAPQVVIARVQGPALGGGLGLVCVCDIAVAGSGARFALPEVRLGLVPSVISPYVIARVGLPRARQLMLTGQEIGGAAAYEYGLVTHTTGPDEELDHLVEDIISDILKGAPQALRECKRLLFEVASSGGAQTLDYRIDLLNRLRSGTEAQEGMLAFMQRRRAPWQVGEA
jgi:enoyl-CoA hydratase/carnithine racemase